MNFRSSTSTIHPALLAALILPAASLWLSAAPGRPQSPPAQLTQASPSLGPFSDAEIRERTAKLVENQHRDDNALDLYERIEHHIDRTSGPNPRTLDDRVYRVGPTGGGTFRILLRDQGADAKPAEYRHSLQSWEAILEVMARPDDPKAKSAYEKYHKREHDRDEFVDAAGKAYLPKWLRRETWHGRNCDVFQLEPNPDFHSHSMFQEALTHIAAEIWVDRDAVQIAHAEAQVSSDVSFGGGIFGKLYRGGVVSIDQAEIAPGIWFPTREEYEFAGRKFLFPFEQHQIIEFNHYHRIGPPAEALVLIQGELASGKPFITDP